jgi:predicted DNA-binding protein with PD1-like motif
LRTCEGTQAALLIAAQQTHQAPERGQALIFQTGDEFLSLIRQFAAENRLNAGSFTATGAFESVVLGYFDWQKKDYKQGAADAHNRGNLN